MPFLEQKFSTPDGVKKPTNNRELFMVITPCTRFHTVKVGNVTSTVNISNVFRTIDTDVEILCNLLIAMTGFKIFENTSP